MSYDPHGYHQPQNWQQPPTQQVSAQPQYAPTQPMHPGYAQAPPPPKSPKISTILLIIGGAIAAVLVIVGAAEAGRSDKAEREQRAALATPSVMVTTTPPIRTGTPVPLSPVEDAKPVVMPDVRGQNAAVAENYLRQLGFVNIKFGTQDELDDWVVLPENWTVRKQSTKAGRKIPTDTLIVLTCTKQS